MPALTAYRCPNCSFSLPSSRGSGMAVLDAWGTRIPCLPPGEFATAADVLGLSKADFTRAFAWAKGEQDAALAPAEAARVQAQAALINERVVYTTTCQCFRCGAVSDVDAKLTSRTCPVCGSSDLHTGGESLGRQCPSCRSGVIQASDSSIRA